MKPKIHRPIEYVAEPYFDSRRTKLESDGGLCMGYHGSGKSSFNPDKTADTHSRDASTRKDEGGLESFPRIHPDILPFPRFCSRYAKTDYCQTKCTYECDRRIKV